MGNAESDEEPDDDALEDDAPLAVFALGSRTFRRDFVLVALALVPLAACPFVVPFDPGRAAALAMLGTIFTLCLVPVLGSSLRRDAATEVELRRDALVARGPFGRHVVIRWRDLARVSWTAIGTRWISSDVVARDGTRVTLTHWLEGGQACAFLVREAGDTKAFPWRGLGAADWAAPGTVQRSAGDGVVERASSGRARCARCGELITRGELRYGQRLRSPRRGRPTTRWHHVSCAEDTFGADVVERARRQSRPI